jgi:hypothetical protein
MHLFSPLFETRAPIVSYNTENGSTVIGIRLFREQLELTDYEMGTVSSIYLDSAPAMLILHLYTSPCSNEFKSRPFWLSFLSLFADFSSKHRLNTPFKPQQRSLLFEVEQPFNLNKIQVAFMH